MQAYNWIFGQRYRVKTIIQFNLKYLNICALASNYYIFLVKFISI